MRVFLVAALTAGFMHGIGSAPASAQSLEPASVESGSDTIAYSIRRFDPSPVTAESAESLPDSAVATARRIARHLAAGEIEDAALLSNAPKRRYEVLMDYRESVGDAEFKRVYAEYADPRNPLLAELAIGPRRVLVWRLAPRGNLAAQYYVEVQGRFLLDDIPSDERTRLRRVFETYRAGPEFRHGQR